LTALSVARARRAQQLTDGVVRNSGYATKRYEEQEKVRAPEADHGVVSVLRFLSSS
jgi:hypothetical protein